MKKAILWEKFDGGKVKCLLCAHACIIDQRQRGFCGVRENIDEELFTHAYGKAIASHYDPIEKKPLYHFLPGSRSYSIATMGCNMKCSFCQNWRISQRPLEGGGLDGYDLSPEDIVREALKNNCLSIAYTYTEPTIFFEYASDTAKIAKEKALKNVFVTNGYMTEKAIDEVTPYLDAANVDLKSFRDETYKDLCKARLGPVLDTIRKMHENGIWIEITTLLIPGENDSERELSEIADFIAEVDINIPWHISAYHPDFKYRESPGTSVDAIEKAMRIAKQAGLRYVYPGNVSLRVDTTCPVCSSELVRRDILDGKLTEFLKDGKCKSCGTHIAGIWG